MRESKREQAEFLDSKLFLILIVGNQQKQPEDSSTLGQAVFHTEMQRIDYNVQTPLQLARVDERIDEEPRLQRRAVFNVLCILGFV